LWLALLALLGSVQAGEPEPNLVLYGRSAGVEMSLLRGWEVELRLPLTDCSWELVGADGGIEVLEAQPSHLLLRGARRGEGSVTLELVCPSRVVKQETWAFVVLGRRGPSDGELQLRVTELVGNVEPGGAADEAQHRGRPVAATVHLFDGEVPVMTAPDAHHPQLLRVLETDGLSPLVLALPAGRYSACAVIDGELVYDGTRGGADGTWYRSFVVFPGRSTAFTIRDKRQAEF
jgi:hypothetical protein